MDVRVTRGSADYRRWQQMLASLAPMSSLLGSGHAEACQSPGVSDEKHRDSVRNSVCVEILERLSLTCIVVSWADATSGRYGEQTWTLRIARRKGVCSLSGEPYAAGSAIYRPRARQRSATNTGQIISAAAIARLESGEPARPMGDALSAGRCR
jgi:hypothetical protein